MSTGALSYYHPLTPAIAQTLNRNAWQQFSYYPQIFAIRYSSCLFLTTYFFLSLLEKLILEKQKKEDSKN